VAGNSTTPSGASIDLASNNAITVSGGVVTVKTLEPVRFGTGVAVYLTNVQAASGNAANAALYNATFTDSGSTTAYGNGFTVQSVATNLLSFTFNSVAGMNTTDVLGASGITNFGWLQAAEMFESNITSSPLYYRPLIARRNQPRWRLIADPEYVSVEQDLGTGVLKVRFLYVPGTVMWNVGLTYQAQAPLLNSMTQTFSPIPDHYSALIRQAILYRCYRHKGDPREEAEYQKMQAMIAKSTMADNAAESNIYLEPIDQLADLPGPFWIGY
jgi:hypothetical protein